MSRYIDNLKTAEYNLRISGFDLSASYVKEGWERMERMEKLIQDLLEESQDTEKAVGE